MGNSTNKKDAQSNAARDFVNYLVRINEVKSEEVPAVGVSIYDRELELFLCSLSPLYPWVQVNRFTGCVYITTLCERI